ncbi:carbohydrate-binding protein SusD [Tamlana sp. s12]|nr:carbohydrate-binding protein SusD [Tamlana sp. s12]
MRKILILGILMATFSSCSDFIEEENLSSESAESFYVTAEGFNDLVSSNYAQLRNIYGDAPDLFVLGTDLYSDGRDQAPVGLARYTGLNPISENVDIIYNEAYVLIQLANRALHYAELTEQTPELPGLVGEVKFLRALSYFLLVQTYGDVAITDFINTPVLEFERVPSNEVYEYIINDLNESIAAVGTAAYIGRVNQRAAKNLLAKVYLTRGYESFGEANDFAMAAQLADEVIAGQSLNLSFEDLWAPLNDINEETLFSVQYDEKSISADPDGIGSPQYQYFGSYLGGSEVIIDGVATAPYRDYAYTVTDFALGLYEQGDTRWEATFMTEVYDYYFNYYRVADLTNQPIRDFYEPSWFTDVDKANYLATKNLTADFEYHNWGEYSSEHTDVVAFDYGTICVKKFDDPLENVAFGEKSSTRDIVLARLGETYLVAAEAYLHTNAGIGLDRLNEVRRRAGVAPATAAEFDIDYILDERARELLGEYHRWFDLKRTGKLVERASMYNKLIETSSFNGANGELKILRPIPQQAIDLNQNRDFKQNPAYQ